MWAISENFSENAVEKLCWLLWRCSIKGDLLKKNGLVGYAEIRVNLLNLKGLWTVDFFLSVFKFWLHFEEIGTTLKSEN